MMAAVAPSPSEINHPDEDGLNVSGELPSCTACADGSKVGLVAEPEASGLSLNKGIFHTMGSRAAMLGSLRSTSSAASNRSKKVHPGRGPSDRSLPRRRVTAVAMVRVYTRCARVRACLLYVGMRGLTPPLLPSAASAPPMWPISRSTVSLIQ